MSDDRLIITQDMIEKMNVRDGDIIKIVVPIDTPWEQLRQLQSQLHQVLTMQLRVDAIGLVFPGEVEWEKIEFRQLERLYLEAKKRQKGDL